MFLYLLVFLSVSKRLKFMRKGKPKEWRYEFEAWKWKNQEMRSKKKEEKDVFATKLCSSSSSSSSSSWFNFHQRKGWLSFYVFFQREKLLMIFYEFRIEWFEKRRYQFVMLRSLWRMKMIKKNGFWFIW